MARKIAILGGTGPEGSGLANRLARAGEHIIIGSRDASRAQDAAKKLREQIGKAAQIEGTENAAAAGQCDIAVLTVPFSGQAALLKQLKPLWKPGAVVIDTTVPLAASVGGAATRTVGVWQGSAGEAARELLPAGVLLAGVQRRRGCEESGDGTGWENPGRSRVERRKAGERANCGVHDGFADRAEYSLQGARRGDSVHGASDKVVRRRKR
jgi:8-hydroxy-5-deazaflavin:NADPH oxidoreductase